MTGIRLLEDLVGGDRASIPELLAARVARSPDAPFVRDGGRRWTYAEAWAEALRFAGFLDGLGAAGPDRRVASYLTNRAEALWVLFGTHASGSVYVSLNRDQRGAILADMLRRSGAAVLVTEESALARLPPLAEVGIEHLIVVGAAPAAGAIPWSAVEAAAPGETTAPDPAALATIMFTSGTTGRSKAVRLPHNQFCRGAAHIAHAFGLRGDDVIHLWMPLFHIGGQLHLTMSGLVAGAELALFPTFSRSRFWAQVEEVGATFFAGFANVMHLLWSLPPRPGDRDNSLRAGLIGLVPPDLHRPFEARFGVRVMDTYGMTEAEPLTLPLPEGGEPIGSCGRPGPDFELAVHDDAGRAVPAGEVGELCVRPRVGDVMFQGYEGDAEATAAAWRGGWFHTGDLGYVDAADFVYFSDRLKHAIRCRGENVSSWEVEQILRRHPDIGDCAVVGVPAPLGEEDVKAVVSPRRGTALEPAELHAFCRREMARFMVPRYIEVRRALPYSDAGKVLKEQLRELGPGIWDAERAAPVDSRSGQT